MCRAADVSFKCDRPSRFLLSASRFFIRFCMVHILTKRYLSLLNVKITFPLFDVLMWLIHIAFNLFIYQTSITAIIDAT